MAQTHQGFDQADATANSDLVSAGSAIASDQAAYVAIGNDLADGMALAAQLDQASLLLDPGQYVGEAGNLVDALTSAAGEASVALVEPDLTAFQVGGAPAWSGGITVPTPVVTTKPPSGSSSGGGGGPYIFIPSPIVTPTAAAAFGGVAATVGVIAGTIIPVINAFLAFNYIIGGFFDFNGDFQAWAKYLQDWFAQDPVAAETYVVNLQIKEWQQDLSSGAVQGSQKIQQVKDLIAKSQAYVAKLQQMSIVKP